MPSFVILLRAVNVGGTGKLAMSDFKAMGEAVGLRAVRTYIASGNMVVDSDDSELEIKAALEKQLLAYAGKPVGVVVRAAAEMAEVLARNPFPTAAAKYTVAIFLDAPPSRTALDGVTGRDGEEIALGEREIYVQYGPGMGRSKLKIPAAKLGTARNMNTIATLASMAGSSQES